MCESEEADNMYRMEEEGWRTQAFTHLYEMMNEEKFCDTKIITGK